MNTIASFLIIPVSFPALVSPVIRFSKAAWQDVDAKDVLIDHFGEIRVTVEKWLTANEIAQVSGALGYALRSTLCGEDLSEPHIIQSHRAGQTVLLFSNDSTKSRRDDPCFHTAFSVAREFVQYGSPIRTTNRAGIGTRGTRLVSGIGAATVRFAVR